jgi:S-DNA-T family DNA segregation ATPase FtsK/SpoIIIE
MNDDQTKISNQLMAKMISLGFVAKFTRCEAGPIITQYFFKPIATAQLSKIMNRTEDLALSVGRESILIQRILDEISVSVPNLTRELIRFDSCLHWLATANENSGMVLPLLMGTSPTGQKFSLDLSTQPHILISGSTGGGKSVFLSQLIASLAVQKDPKELQLILVDTKQLDLTLFSSLSHVTEMVDKVEDLHDTLDNLLSEVRRRTELMKGLARNLKEFNVINDKKLPYKVLIIDELADVISQDKELKKDETSDTRRTRISDKLIQLAAISRAAGVHIIAATQRPSIEVISGNFKTNFPTRISFRLPSSTDSRVILDENGAESLLGKGDYLYRTSESSQLNRAHGSFVSMDDIALVIDQHEYIRETFKFQREQQIQKERTK